MIWDLAGEWRSWILPGLWNKEHIKWDFSVDADGSGKAKEDYLNTCLNIQSYTSWFVSELVFSFPWVTLR